MAHRGALAHIQLREDTIKRHLTTSHSPATFQQQRDRRALSRPPDTETLCYRAVPLGAAVGAGLPWPVVWGADVVVFTASVTVLLTP